MRQGTLGGQTLCRRKSRTLRRGANCGATHSPRQRGIRSIFFVFLPEEKLNLSLGNDNEDLLSGLFDNL